MNRLLVLRRDLSGEYFAFQVAVHGYLAHKNRQVESLAYSRIVPKTVLLRTKIKLQYNVHYKKNKDLY